MDNIPASETWWGTLARPIDQETAHHVFGFCAEAIQRGVQTIHIAIQSSGGMVGDAVAIHNYLSSIPVKVITHNIGGVSSAAVMVFLAGAHRVATDTATFMIHKSSMPVPGGSTASQLGIIAETLSLEDGRIETILKRHVKLPAEKWELHHRSDVIITSQEAMKFELIHEIAQFAPPPGATMYNI